MAGLTCIPLSIWRYTLNIVPVWIVLQAMRTYFPMYTFKFNEDMLIMYFFVCSFLIRTIISRKNVIKRLFRYPSDETVDVCVLCGIIF